jgi:hypothetical protein
VYNRIIEQEELAMSDFSYVPVCDLKTAKRRYSAAAVISTFGTGVIVFWTTAAYMTFCRETNHDVELIYQFVSR